jgi:hypothetical protein
MRTPISILALGAALLLGTACQRSPKYEAGADTETDCGEGGSFGDPQTGLTWEASPACEEMSCGEAVSRCDDLVESGFDDWRLPTIGELRTLVLGCDDVQTGGACGVTDECAEISCWDLVCYGCGELGGPGTGGCYWDPIVDGHCASYWSSPVWSASGIDSCWYISFDGSYLNYVNADDLFYARCVRGTGV